MISGIKWNTVWGIFMTVFYLCMGSVFIFSNIFDIRRGFLVAIGILFIIYGLFRGYRLWRYNY